MSDLPERPTLSLHDNLRPARVPPPRVLVLVGSALLFAAALLGNVASGIFVHGVPGYRSTGAEAQVYYVSHYHRGVATAIFSAVAVLALGVFVWAVYRTIASMKTSGKPGKFVAGLYWLLAGLLLVTYLGCRVVALGLGIYYSRQANPNLADLHRANQFVNFGTLGIGVTFALYALAVATALAIYGAWYFKVFAAVMVVLAAAAEFGFGFGISIWILILGIALGVYAFIVRRQANRTDTAPLSAVS